jgi:hypothetical protein
MSSEKAFLLALLFLPVGHGADMDAHQVLKEVRTRGTFKTLEYSGTLRTFDRDTKPLERQWLFRGTGESGRRKTTLRFLNPPEIRGVSILILNQPSGRAAQWMWIPSLGRDRRIAAQDRSASVFGTDFSFEDLEDHNLDRYDASFEPDVTLDGAPCHRIRARPLAPRESQYSALVLTVDKERLVVRMVKCFRGSQLARSIYLTDFRPVQGILTAFQTEVLSPETGSRTVLTLDKVRYNLPFGDSAFTREALRLPR